MCGLVLKNLPYKFAWSLSFFFTAKLLKGPGKAIHKFWVRVSLPFLAKSHLELISSPPPPQFPYLLYLPLYLDVTDSLTSRLAFSTISPLFGRSLWFCRKYNYFQYERSIQKYIFMVSKRVQNTVWSALGKLQ